MFELGKQQMSEKCPRCGQTIRFTLNDVAQGRKPRCSCGVVLVDDGSVKKSLNSVDKAMRDLERRFKKLGK